MMDPNRPRSAAELVTSGNLKPWWNMSWREITPYFPETAGYQAFLKEAGQETPPLVINRLSTVLAAFRYFQRPLEGDSPMANQVGPELLRFEVPGQQIIVLACRIPFPEYEANESCTHFATMSHGTSFSSVIGIAQHGGITVSHNKDDSFPSFGFSARGSLVSLSRLASEIRQQLGCKTLVRHAKDYEKERTAKVERFIQTVPRHASTLVEAVMERTQLEFPSEHAIRAWAVKHSVFLLNRFHFIIR